MTRLYVLTFEGKRAADASVPHAHESGVADDRSRWWCWPPCRSSALVWGLPLSPPAAARAGSSR